MHKLNQETYARLFKMLLTDPVTPYELADETGLHIVTAQRLMKIFKKHKVVHVSAWEPNTRGIDTTPVYTLGEGKHKPKRRKSDAQRTSEYRARKKRREIPTSLMVSA